MTLTKTIYNWTARLAVALVMLPAVATTYYVDSVAGNDTNSGTATNSAWQSLAKINAKTFSPGDWLLLKCGGSWTGTMSPKGSGANGNPIILNSSGTNNAMPVINGNGNTDALVLTNQQYWEINNLEVINPGSGTNIERRGIHLCAANFGPVNHLYVSNCFVHGICGKVDTSDSDTVAKRSGGIIVEVISDSGGTVPTWFNDILIQSCTITSVTNQGIVACGNRSADLGGYDYPGTPGWNSRNCSHLVIRNNVISWVCKNAMSIRYADESCLIEHNLVHDTANTTDGNQICSYASRGTVFQYNEGYHNNGDGLHDGSLYDADLRSPQTIWQYSYSHDNSWGLFCHYASSDSAGDPYGNDTRIIVRYNISQNDRGDIFALSGDSGATAGEYFYNNTIYSTNPSTLFFDDRSGGHTYYAYNNIFYSLNGTNLYNFHSYNTHTFDHDAFYGAHPSDEPGDSNKMTNNPAWVAPGTGGGVGGTTNLSTLAGYELQAGSPCIDSGLTITTNMTGNTNAGGLDFFGVAVPYGAGTDRGAGEWIPTNQPPSVSLLAPAIRPNSATLPVQVNPGNAPTSCYFVFGTTTNYGSYTATNSIAGGTNSLTVSNLVSGLLSSTLYHYRAVATNSVGGINTSDATFTTTVVTSPRLNVSGFTGGGNLQVNFTNTPGASFTVLATTNLSLARSNWITLGAAIEISPGQFQWVDGLTNRPAQFYQIRCP